MVASDAPRAAEDRLECAGQHVRPVIRVATRKQRHTRRRATRIAGVKDIAREGDRERRRKRSPLLIARQARYPLEGDEARFVSETPPDGSTVPCGVIFTKTWTIRNSGTIPWHGRRLRRIGPTTGPWTLTSERFTPIPDTEPGQTVSITVTLKAPMMETAAVAQWKMVDQDDLLYFPDRYSVGVALYVLVGHEGSPEWAGHSEGDKVG